MAGNLDLTFNGSGYIIGDLQNSVISSIQLQDDKIVIAGYDENYFAFLARYNSNGTIDDTFGISGFVNTINTIETSDQSSTMIVLPNTNNEILLLCNNGGTLAIKRFNSNGTFINVLNIVDNPSFIPIRFNTIQKYLSTDNFVVSYNSSGVIKYVRYQSNGTPLTATITTLITDINPYKLYSLCNTLDNSNNIIFGGRQNRGNFFVGITNRPFYLVYKSNDTVKDDIGESGFIYDEAHAGNINGYTGITTDASNNIYLMGDFVENVFINKYNFNGELTDTIDISGTGTATSLLLQSDNKILANYQYTILPENYDVLAVSRLNTDLTVDLGFNRTIFNISNNENIMNKLLLQTNTKLLVAGYTDFDNGDIGDYYRYIILRINLTNTDTITNKIFCELLDKINKNKDKNKDKNIIKYIIQQLGLYNQNISQDTANYFNKLLK